MSWLILGAGISGCGAAALLRSKNQQVTIYDDQQLSLPTVAKLQLLGVTIAKNTRDALLFSKTPQGLVLSPGIAQSHPLVVAAQGKQIPIISEIDLALQYFQGRLLGVTGTNGKSTIAAMAFHLLKRSACDVALAGNIGLSLCDYLADHPSPAFLVLELSSYQLELSKGIKADVGIIVNLSPDHLERHGDELSYYQAKWRLLSEQRAENSSFISEAAWQTSQDCGLAPPNCKLTVVKPEDEATLFPFSCPEIASPHNRQNATLATLGVAALLHQAPQTIAPLIRGYQGLAYRYQIICQQGSYAIINDSKATNVAATVAALASSQGPLILFLGGKGKGESFHPLSAFKDRIIRIIAFGYSANEISAELSKDFPLVIYPSLKEALSKESLRVVPLKASILFSPACASYDEFANFEERGKFFNSFFS